MNTNKPGAQSEENDSDALSLALSQISVPDCPKSHQSFIDNTSLERLVYWKIQSMFERFDDLPFKGILQTILTNVERPLFALVLLKTNGNQFKAAEILGCNRNTVCRKLKGFMVLPKDLRRAMTQSNRTKQALATGSNDVMSNVSDECGY